MIEDDTEKCTVGTKRWVTMGQKEQFYDKSTPGTYSEVQLGTWIEWLKATRRRASEDTPSSVGGLERGLQMLCQGGNGDGEKRGSPLNWLWGLGSVVSCPAGFETGTRLQTDFIFKRHRMPLVEMFSSICGRLCRLIFAKFGGGDAGSAPSKYALNLYSIRSPGPGVVSSCMHVIFCLFTQKKM